MRSNVVDGLRFTAYISDLGKGKFETARLTLDPWQFASPAIELAALNFCMTIEKRFGKLT
jgi:hypothetical protein